MGLSAPHFSQRRPSTSIFVSFVSFRTLMVSGNPSVFDNDSEFASKQGVPPTISVA